MKKILITGCAGFIGSQLANKLLSQYKVIGIDNLDNYYSVKLKKLRLKILKSNKNFTFHNIDIRNSINLNNRLKKYKFDYVFHFAAQAGVRHSIIDPNKYTTTNIFGTLNLLDLLKSAKPKKIFLASSSSVYGNAKKFPIKESTKLNPKNHYAYTKQINEVTGNLYSKIYDLNIYMLRLFTVFGPFGRPDMFLMKLFKSAYTNEKFYLNNKGNHERDFTYIDDVTEILSLLLKKKITYKYDIFNICSNKPMNIAKIFNYINSNLIKVKYYNKAKNYLDANKTHGCNKKIKKLTSLKSFTNQKKGINKLFEWYTSNEIYKIS